MNKDSLKRASKFFIIICAIIAVVVFIVIYIMNIVKKEKIKEMQADLLLVQAKVEIVKGKNNVNKDENPLRGLQISKIGEKVNIKAIMEKHGITGDDLAKYYVLRDSDLAVMELGELIGKNKGAYIVNYDNYEVIYTLGYTNTKGLTCYKVSEINKEPEIQKVIPASSSTTEEIVTPAETTTPVETATPAEATTTDNATQTSATPENQASAAETTTNQEATVDTTIENENTDEQIMVIVNRIKNKTK